MFSHNYENNVLIWTLTVLVYIFSNSAITGIQEHLYCISNFLPVLDLYSSNDLEVVPFQRQHPPWSQMFQ